MLEINDTKELTEVTFRINFKLIQKHQESQPSIIDKYKYGTYHKIYFSVISNINLKLITCEDRIVIKSKNQSYILHWYHMYLLNL